MIIKILQLLIQIWCSSKSRLIATVRFPPHAAIVDVTRIRDALVTNEFQLNGAVSIVRQLVN